MSLFDRLTEQALRSNAALGVVRPAVEKELLHYDILRELSRAGLLARLTFIGGTCLRACYGSPRLSEDLDFTGGTDFEASRLGDLGAVLEATLMEKYGLPVKVDAPVRETGNVSTWKLRLQTRPAAKHLPVQRIHIDVCALPSHRRRPALLRNPYGLDMGTDGLIVQVQTREEILADKWVALAFRPNRIQYRDLWDILWLDRRGVILEAALVAQKLVDRRHSRTELLAALRNRIGALETVPQHRNGFRKEMERFLPASETAETVQRDAFWDILLDVLQQNEQTLRAASI